MSVCIEYALFDREFFFIVAVLVVKHRRIRLDERLLSVIYFLIDDNLLGTYPN